MHRATPIHRPVKAAVLLLIAAGCAHRPAPLPAPSAAAAPSRSPEAVSPPEAAGPAPQPVYRNPRIGVVYLRAYQDGQGRLVGPQVIYQITDPGGWNTAALDGGGGYVPAANRADPPHAEPGGLAAPLLDPAAAARIAFTGLMRRDQEPEARAMAAGTGPDWRPVFDEQAGWLLVPPSGADPASRR